MHSALAPVLRGPLLHGSGACITGIGILIYSWYCGIGVSSGDGICSSSASSRRLQPEPNTMKIPLKSMPSPGKGKAKRNPARARRVARKEKTATHAEVTGKRQQNTHDSMENVEIVESMDTKHLIVGTSRRTNVKVKARARESRNPKLQKSVKVTTVNKSKKLGHQTRQHSSQIYLK